MELKLKSFNARFYSWFYMKTEYRLPTNYIKYYFYLIMAWLWLIPYALYCGVYILFEPLDSMGNRLRIFDNTGGTRIIISTFINSLIFFIGFYIGCWIYPVIKYYNPNIYINNIVLWIAGVIWLLLILIKIYMAMYYEKFLIKNKTVKETKFKINWNK